MLDIVGGAYFENCKDPSWSELFGSGFRAAIGLANLTKVKFHTYADKRTKQILEDISYQLGIDTSVQQIEKSIEFGYQHPLSKPLMYPGAEFFRTNRPIQIENTESCICYGMIEGNAVIHANRVVYDPQQPEEPLAFDSNGSTSNELIYVLNLGEARILTGSDNIEDFRSYFFKKANCAAAIIKNGPRGAIVIEKGRQNHPVGLYQTEKVWPIGSGDVFTAAFAYSWLVDKKDIQISSRIASLATAQYVNSKSLPIKVDLSSALFPELIPLKNDIINIYLAGPFFSMAQRWLIDEARTSFLKLGAKVFSPLHDVGLGGPGDVVEKDISGLERCDIVFAVADGLDSGTLFEIGYATAKDKPVVCLFESENLHSMTMLIGTGCEIESDFTTAIYKTIWKGLSLK